MRDDSKGRSKKALEYFCVSLVGVLALAGCSTQPSIYLGQGLMAGEVSTGSVILQARLTLTDHLVDGDLPGSFGVGRFVVSTWQNFSDPIVSDWHSADPERDFIIKIPISGLEPNTRYYYRLEYGLDRDRTTFSPKASFRTHPAADQSEPFSFVVVTGMNYYKFHYGNFEITEAYPGKDKELGYPALETIRQLKPDYFVGTGDNVYFDCPREPQIASARKRGKNPHPGNHDGREVTTEKGMRKKYHEQFGQTRFRQLFQDVATYWEKDDHDYRFNDADGVMEHPITHEMGIENFREQLPVCDPMDADAVTYRTYRVGKLAQLWFVEGRDYRSPNTMGDGPDKTLWGEQQIAWLKETLAASDATFKLLISPTPLVGPDDAYKRDNHVNHKGFRHEGDTFFQWLSGNGFLQKNFFLLCGDRHWQYHSIHPSGFEEFSCGALVDNNARIGRSPGDPKSTDPQAEIKQIYTQSEPSGGFLHVSVKPGSPPKLTFTFFDEKGQVLYSCSKTASGV